MRYLIGIMIMLALSLAAGAPAGAQTGERIFDTLTDLFRSPNQQLEGHVVALHDRDVVVRGKDNRTYTIDMTGIDPRALGPALQQGQPIRVKVRRDGDRLVAVSAEGGTGSPRSFRTVSGVVDQVSGDRMQFRTNEGFVIPIDLAQIVGRRPSLRPGDAASLTYEMSGDTQLAGVWVEPRDAMGAASPSTIGTRAGYERVRGFVDSIGVRSLTLKADDGRTLLVDIANSRGGSDVRPGDLVHVVGRSAGDRFVAEMVQKD